MDTLLPLPPSYHPLIEGGGHFAEWIRLVMQEYLGDGGVIDAYIEIAVQIGEDSGEVVSTRLPHPIRRMIDSHIIGKCRRETADARNYYSYSRKEKGIGEITYTLHSIDELLDRSIGFIVTASTKEQEPLSHKITSLVSRFISSAIHSAKNYHATRIINNYVKTQQCSFNDLAEWCRMATSSAGVVIWVHFAENETNGCSYLSAEGATVACGFDMSPDEGLAGFSFKNNAFVRIDNLTDEDEIMKATGRKIAHPEAVGVFGWKSGVFLPLGDGNTCTGVLGVYGKRFHGFNNWDLEIAVRCASQISHKVNVVQSTTALHDYQRRLKELTKEVDVSRHLIVGRVHDAFNKFQRGREHFSYVRPSTSTAEFYEIASSLFDDAWSFLRDLRDRFSARKRIDVSISKFDLHSFIEKELRSIKVDAANRDIDFKVSCTPGLTIECDAYRLSSILYNLVHNSINAFQHLKRKGKLISISARENSSAMQITVSDNACGIQRHKLDDIMKPFISETSGGMGLGLWMVSTYVSELGGTIKIESEWGEYTNITLELPLTHRM